ncbi:uncharacterized protein LOC118434715 [Folsomia candida]|uniref:uncharacterized protein LOC118434715 n=1 Tax=Folsomia candida TaxID=158441 RepID=UPI001604B385|nr:uncharacterized protein LOC118434715 [Folsomia candida]
MATISLPEFNYNHLPKFEVFPHYSTKPEDIPFKFVQRKSQNLADPSRKHKNFTVAAFLVTCFNFGFTLLIFPFRFKRQLSKSSLHLFEPESSLILYTNKFQQMLCALAHALLMFQYFSECRQLPFSSLNPKTHPGIYFLIFDDVTDFIYKGVTILVLWVKKDKFYKVITFITDSGSRNLEVFRLNRALPQRLAIILYGYYTVLAVLSTFLGFANASSPTVSRFWRTYLGIGRYNFFLSGASNFAQSSEISSPKEIAFASMALVGMIFRQFFSIFADGLVLAACATLWWSARNLAHIVRKDITLIELQMEQQKLRKNKIYFESEYVFCPENTLKEFDALRTLSSLMNKAISAIVLCYVTEALFYYSTGLNAIFLAKDWLRRVRSITFFLNMVGILFMSGDTCRQVNRMAEWISAIKKKSSLNLNAIPILDSDESTVLLNELKNRSISITGHIFVMDYNAVFSIIGTMVTYFIIFLSSD